MFFFWYGYIHYWYRMMFLGNFSETKVLTRKLNWFCLWNWVGKTLFFIMKTLIIIFNFNSLINCFQNVELEILKQSKNQRKSLQKGICGRSEFFQIFFPFMNLIISPPPPTPGNQSHTQKEIKSNRNNIKKLIEFGNEKNQFFSHFTPFITAILSLVGLK